jgi:CheY-like chemotaxis protein
VVQVEIIDLNQLLTNLQPMIKTALGDTSKVVLNLSPQPLFISANTMQLEQAVMNLTFNSAMAMKNGGTFTIQTSAFSDDRVLLKLEDTGTGMDTEIIERAFEPYFSTHKGSEGTGLGLAMVHGIVTRFGGNIALESKRGHGTTCTMLWPQVQQTTPEPIEPSPESISVVRTLVVDDELPILRMVSRILQRTGHTISTADSVRSAVDLIEHTPEDHDLLVCDVCLKDGNGTAVMMAARQRWPDIAVLYISGFTGTMLNQHDLSPGEHNFLAKPFRPKDLIASTKALIQHRAIRASKKS